MSTKSVASGEGTPEFVALKLLVAVAASEEFYLEGLGGGSKTPTRQWILDTYAECLSAAHARRVVTKE